MSRWTDRALKEVASARSADSLALRNSLPIYLDHLSEALSSSRKMDAQSVLAHSHEAIRIGRLHGADRAGCAGYVLSEVIFEYHLLRVVIFEVLETQGPLPQEERDIILDSIEQAVNDAAVRFSEVHADIQQKFVATLTHDLKNPLAGAKANADLILRRSDKADLCRQSASRILATLTRLDHMIEDLLDASRIRAGEELSLVFLECDLDGIVREVVDEMTVIHGGRFVLKSEEQIEGRWGCDGLRRAVENLLGNAVKYSTPDTPITINLKDTATSAELTVHNEGSPIPENEQKLLFEQYRRSKSAQESAKTGWGLGLTLVKGVVDAHGGTVRVESGPGRGTSFILELPRSLPGDRK